jgi:hypothetical protein
LVPLIEFSQLEQKIKDEDVVLKEPPVLEDPSLMLEREVRLTPEFNLKQLKILAHMLSVEEWENAKSFKINWINSNPELPLRRFVLYYNQKKRILKKKYVYRGRDSLIEQKENVFKQKLQGAAERKDSSILGEGFKEINKG